MNASLSVNLLLSQNLFVFFNIFFFTHLYPLIFLICFLHTYLIALSCFESLYNHLFIYLSSKILLTIRRRTYLFV